MPRTLIRTAVVVAAVAMGGCSDPNVNTELDTTFVGYLDDGETAVALSVRDGKAVGYTCGSESLLQQRTMWFNGKVSWFEDGSVMIDCGDFSLMALPFDDLASGYVRFVDGTITTFTADSVAQESHAGLYGDRDPQCASAAVAYEDADGAITIQGAFCAGGVMRQVTPMEPMVIDERGLGVHIEDSDSTMFFPVISP